MVDPVFPVDAQWEYDVYQLMEEMDKKTKGHTKKKLRRKRRKNGYRKKISKLIKANLREKKKSFSEKQ